MLKSVTFAGRSPVCQFLSLQSTTQRSHLNQWLENSVHKRNFFLLSHNCLFNQKTRNFVAKVKVEQGKDNEPFRFLERMGQCEALQEKNIQILTEVLQCSEKEARSLIVNEYELFGETFDLSITKLKLLMSQGITSNAILNNIWILHITLSRLRTYFIAISLWDIDESYIEEFLPLFDVTPKEFFYVSQRFIKEKATCPCGNRVIYIASRLDCPASEILIRMLRKKFLFMRSIQSIEEVLNLFEEFGIRNEDIVADLSSLGGRMEVMRERLMKLREIGYYPIKPWLTRYEYEKFEKAINFFLAEKEAQDFESRAKYLAAQMNVDETDITGLRQEMYRKYPYLFNIRALTFMKKLKFLLSEGYIPQDLINKPYAFYVKINTLKDRIDKLRKLGFSKPCLQVVTKNEKRFMYFLQNTLTDREIKPSDVSESHFGKD